MTREEYLKQNSEKAVHDDLGDIRTVQSRITGTWRHGNEVEIVVQDTTTSKFYMANYQDGDADFNSFSDINGETLNWIEVEPVEVRTVGYKKIT